MICNLIIIRIQILFRNLVCKCVDNSKIMIYSNLKSNGGWIYINMKQACKSNGGSVHVKQCGCGDDLFKEVVRNTRMWRIDREENVGVYTWGRKGQT